MKLITTSKELDKVFNRLIKEYDSYYWATAWASDQAAPFEKLLSYRNRINKIVVGTHFYQTHPSFIEEFIDDDKVRFIKQPDGTFHPKVYLFYKTDNNWELLIGSANFTGPAFLNNTEATMLIGSKDSGSETILKDALKIIDKSWGEARSFDRQELDGYRATWLNQRPKLNSLSGKYGERKRTAKPIYDVPVTCIGWSDFVAKVKTEPSPHGPKERLEVLTIAKELFSKTAHFNELELEERKFIAGISNKIKKERNVDSGLFGSMMPAKDFKRYIKSNDINISNALDQIPLHGQITRANYDEYIKYFEKSFKSGKCIATATRLLAMKRPDVFVCLDSKNKSQLCKAFGILQSGMTYERYWEEIVARIFDSVWWQNPLPLNDEEEKQIADSRAAFLDALYYKA